jgi:hypothetical protein
MAQSLAGLAKSTGQVFRDKLFNYITADDHKARFGLEDLIPPLETGKLSNVGTDLRQAFEHFGWELALKP